MGNVNGNVAALGASPAVDGQSPLPFTGFVLRRDRGGVMASVESRCCVDTPRVICDFFLDYGGKEYICEVYEAYDGNIEDIGVYMLLTNGTKGEAVDESHLPIWEQAQQKYEHWLLARLED